MQKKKGVLRVSSLALLVAAGLMGAACDDSDDRGQECLENAVLHVEHPDGVMLTNAEARPLTLESRLAGATAWEECVQRILVDPGEGFDDAPMLPRFCGGATPQTSSSAQTMELRARAESGVVATGTVPLKLMDCEASGEDAAAVPVVLTLEE